MKEERCENCKYFDRGHCRYNPPALSNSSFPEVKAIDWCGKFKAKKKEAQATTAFGQARDCHKFEESPAGIFCWYCGAREECHAPTTDHKFERAMLTANPYCRHCGQRERDHA